MKYRIDYIEVAIVAAPSIAGCVVGQAAVRQLAVRAVPELSRLSVVDRNRILSGLNRVILPTRITVLRLILTYGVLLGVLASGALLAAPIWLIGLAYGIVIPTVMITRFVIAKPHFVRAIVQQISQADC